VIGLFVRIGIGVDMHNERVYRLAEIKDYHPTRNTYRVEVRGGGKKECGMLLQLEIGNVSKNFQISFVSNSNLTAVHNTNHIFLLLIWLCRKN